MLVGEVIGRLVSTRKHDKLVGNKFLVCRLLDGQGSRGRKLVAIDPVGAGVGEIVMISTGGSARRCARQENSPVDAAIIGIIDGENNLDMFESRQDK